mmetsp:Transcript_50472/g.152001  ORF Transcript_50472/g.152001 Transcript_50472/m.152001 type:complete len:103 (-) Transcript_50472:1035-1343(-)
MLFLRLDRFEIALVARRSRNLKAFMAIISTICSPISKETIMEHHQHYSAQTADLRALCIAGAVVLACLTQLRPDICHVIDLPPMPDTLSSSQELSILIYDSL